MISGGWSRIDSTEAIPPWPMLLWFAGSHAFFCIVIARVKPYHGPYIEPMAEPTAESWRK